MKAVLFDLGRVLIGYDHARTLAGLASVCRSDPETVEALLDSVSRELGHGTLDGDGLHTLFRERAGAVEDSDLFFQAFASGITRDEEALAYALELESRPELLVAVISNTNASHVRWLDEYIPELRDFDLVMLSNEIGMCKPDPAVYRLALELLDVRAQDAIFVDDSPRNVEGARQLGMAGIVHGSWAQTRPLLEEWLRA